MTDRPIIEARELHTYYGASHILHGVDFTVHAGEAVGLMGRNGMGKTTLIRSLTGHLSSRRGEIKINGRVMTHAAPHLIARQGIAYVPEGRGIFANLTVKENLVMAARPGAHGKHDWTLARVLQTFPRLAERLTHGGQQLSGGEQQMLSIGRALMGDPSLLLLDEPLEGLAPVIVDALMASFLRLRREDNLAIVLVEQHARLALAFANHALVLDRGRIVHRAAAADLLADPQRMGTLLGVAG